MSQYRQQADALIANFGELSAETIQLVLDENTVNVTRFAKHLIVASLGLANDVNDDNAELSENDSLLIKTFVNDVVTTFAHLIDLFDFNGDSTVDLVNVTEGEGGRSVELGADVKAFIDSTGLSTLIEDGSVQDKVMTVLASLLLTMDDAQIEEAHEDIVNFKESINSAYSSLKALKGLNITPVVVSRKDDIMSFIITFLVVFLPVVSFVNTHVASGSTEQITNEQITTAIHTAYGNKLDFIVKIANDLTKKSVKIVDAGLKDKVKKLFKCC